MGINGFDAEVLVRLGVFISAFALMALWEVLAPRRQPATPRSSRWPSNIGIVVLNTLLLRLLFPLTAVGLAMLAQERQWGFLHHITLPAGAQLVVAFLLLDLAIYLQHRLFHIVPVFWRMHRMHHADTEFDLTNGLRFHPLEIGLSMLIKFAVIVLIGAPAIAVLVFEIVLNATSIFNHANVALPLGLDRRLRWILVTPDMHRVHHSVHRHETDSNFGFNLPWWDRLFRTYREQPQDGHVGMQIGLHEFRNPKWLRLDRLLWQPWAKPDSDGDW